MSPRCWRPGARRLREGPRCKQSYRGRVSGPLLDRIDLTAEVPRVTAADLALPPPAEGTAEVVARVAAGPDIHARRAEAAARVKAGLGTPSQLKASGRSPAPTWRDRAPCGTST